MLPIAANNRAREQHKLFPNYQIRTNVTSSKVGTLRFKFNVSACLSSEEVTHLQLDNYRNIYNNFYRTDKGGGGRQVNCIFTNMVGQIQNRIVEVDKYN